MTNDDKVTVISAEVGHALEAFILWGDPGPEPHMTMEEFVKMTERYFIGADNSGHEYYVPVSKREEFQAWAELPEDDEAGWEAPEYAKRIDGEFTFTNPRIGEK